MNELEKEQPMDAASKKENEKVDSFVENENSLKEETQVTGDECVEDSSPALDISEEADALMESENKKTEKADDNRDSATVEKEEKCESSEDVCAEKESPSLEIAEFADEETGKYEDASEDLKTLDEKEAINIHHLNKEQLRDLLKEIIESEEMERHREVTAIKQAFYSLHNRELNDQLNAFIEAGNDPAAFSSTPDVVESEVKELLSIFKEKRNSYLEQKEEERRKNLEEKTRILNELNEIVSDIDNINLHFQKFQQLQQDFKAVGDVPPGAENEIWKNYQQTVEQFYDHLKMNKELRDLDFKKNLEIKLSLTEKAKSLADLQDPVEAFKALQSLHAQWREVGPVAREIREEVWNNFKEITTVINKRHQDFFQERKANEQANEEEKTALCEKVEAIDLSNLKSFADWDNATKEIIALQQEWKGLGFASRKVNNQLFARFRKVCDDFFTAKGEFFKKTKEESKENLQKKEQLCEKAEALLERIEDKKAFDELQAIQKEWKTIGLVRRKQGDEVWKRFCAAVDAFYDGRKKFFSGKREEENTNLEIKKNIIAELKEISDTAEKNEVIDTIRELQKKWQATGFVPFKQKDEVNNEYKAELDRLYKAFDMKENRQRLKRFENDIKKFEGDESKLSKERDRLVRAIESRQAELKTIENNLGFFNFKSSAGNSMMKEFERKIEKIKEEIAQIQDKIKLLDEQPKA